MELGTELIGFLVGGAITFLGMTFAKLGVFSTIGPALAITIIVGFLASITLLPAILALAGRRGLCKPRRELTSRFWRRSGVRIVLHPTRHLVASLIILAILAGCAGVIKFNYDDRKNLPADVDSNVGYAVMAQHFPVNSSIQQFLLVQSPRDLRSPQAPTSSRWPVASARSPASRRCAVSPGRPATPSNKPRPPSRQAPWGTSSRRHRPRSRAATPILIGSRVERISSPTWTAPRNSSQTCARSVMRWA